ncbi:3-hydroxyacyl-CoA dehydrogenase family protein [Acetomicrobium sp. S15 = DSM 107314]|uniref:3-hydroxyacyl-CoA dehydrogenase family protein n=1 Tax=Acetomicrobium sp. S15 = DSM 107314 TaxID=2529858 RepID=UPI001E4BB32C|nr:3-hydroxyacyl-CoA dehydrogenase NAD-binding domain-containing protein [Acetomicrobium sp. S15 = DSM 107314]
MDKVLVYGAGTMGVGIAQVCAAAGKTVFLVGGLERAEEGKEKVASELNRAVQKGKLTAERADRVLEKIIPITDISEILSEVDLIIEVIIEDMAIKKEVFRKIEELKPKPETIFATNTSALSITELAKVTSFPERFLGIHFFNPAPVMKLVEIVKGLFTSDKTVIKAQAFVESLEKTPIVVKESPGFVVNRILVPMINEAAYALMEGVASAEDIDKGMTLGANHPIGPLALADLIGIDVCLAVMETLYREFGDSKYRPCPLLRKNVRAGFLGRKTKRGFFIYE